MIDNEIIIADGEVYDDNDNPIEEAAENDNEDTANDSDTGVDVDNDSNDAETDDDEEDEEIDGSEDTEDAEDTEEDDEDEISEFGEGAREANAVAAMLEKHKINYNSLVDEFERNGRLSPESISRLEKAGYPAEVVKSYITGQQAKYDRYADTVKQTVGGEKAYARLAKWAETNLTRREKLEFNAAVNSGDLTKAKFALKGLKARFENKEGKEVKLVKGAISSKTSKAAKGFSTMEEYQKATDDPRYEKDKAYTRKVDARILATNF